MPPICHINHSIIRQRSGPDKPNRPNFSARYIMMAPLSMGHAGFAIHDRGDAVIGRDRREVGGELLLFR